MSTRVFSGNFSPDAHPHSSILSRFLHRNALKFLILPSIFISLLAAVSPVAAQIRADENNSPKAVHRTSALADAAPAPLMFIRNDGQFDPSIKFEMIGSNGSVVFTDSSIRIALEKPGTQPPWTIGDDSQEGSTPTPVPPTGSGGDSPVVDLSMVEIQFNGVNSTPAVGGENILDTKISYFLGNDPSAWRTDVPAFTEIRYSDFAPGYDLVISGAGGMWGWKLAPNGNVRGRRSSGGTQEFSAKPAAEGDPALPDLSLQVDGGDVGLEGDSIVIGTDAGNITLPLIQVPANTQPDTPTVDGNTVDSPYTDTGTDGTAAPIKYQGAGSNGIQKLWNAAAHFLGLGGFGGGYSASGQPQNQGDATGDLVFSSFLGGPMDDIAFGVAYSKDGNLYVTGRTLQAWSPPSTTPSTFGSRGNWDIFVARIDAQRKMSYLAFIGGGNIDDCSAIEADDDGNAYIVGTTSSINFPTYSVHPPFQQNIGSSNATDIILFKLGPGGNSLLYSTYFGGSNYEDGYDVAFVPNSVGKVYIVGDTNSVSISGVGTPKGWTDGVLAEFDTDKDGSASLLAAKFIGGAHTEEETHGVAVSPLDGSVWVVGHTKPRTGSNDFPILNGFDTTPGGGFDAYVAHYSPGPNLTPLQMSYFGGAGDDCEKGGPYKECDIGVDAAGNAYIAGVTLSTDLATQYPAEGGLQNTGGLWDVFAAKVHAEPCTGGGLGDCLKLDYWRYVGGSGSDISFYLTASAAGDVYISGQTESGDFGKDAFPADLVPFPVRHAGDAFLIRLAPTGYVSYFTYLGGSGTEEGKAVALLESTHSVAVVGGSNGQGTVVFPLVNAVDSDKGTGREPFVSEFTVPDWERPALIVTSPTDWAAVISLRPEFQWEVYPNADHYTITVYNVAGIVSNPAGIYPTKQIRTDLVDASSCVTGTVGDWCFKWREPWLHPDGFELKSGEDLATGGYAFKVAAYTASGTVIANSEPSFFQIPPLGESWRKYITEEDPPNSGNFVCSLWNRGCGKDNPYWHAYDDLFYRWAEYYDLKPSMLKAIMIAETAKDGAEIDIPSDRNNPASSPIFFPPHYAYGYEGGWDWHEHYDPVLHPGNTGLYYRFNRNSDTGKPFDLPFFIWNQEFSDYHSSIPTEYEDYLLGGDHPPHPSEIKCTIIDPIFPALSLEKGDCPFPYKRGVPMEGDSLPVTIYRYGWMYKYAGAFSNTSLGEHALNWVPGCANLKDYSTDCLATKPWMAAQYRTMASYGLGQVVYWTRDYMKNNIPPESLYDPTVGSLESAKALSDMRCLDIPSLGMRSTWDAWNAPLGDYNGDSGYVGRVKPREPYVQSEPIIGSTTKPINGLDIIQVLLPSDQYSCPASSGKVAYSRPGGTGGMPDLDKSFLRKGINLGDMFSPLWNPQERILDQSEFDFGGNVYWVESVYTEHTDLPGIGAGVVRIYADQSKAKLLWQSPAIESVFPYASTSVAGPGSDSGQVMLSEWQIGLHSFKVIPILYSGGVFQQIPVYTNSITPEVGFFSDGGGIFPFPDGSVVAGRRTFENLGDNIYYVYRFTGEQYVLSRIVPSDGSDDTNPPITQATLEPQTNEDGWWNVPVVLQLAGQDDREMLIIKVYQNGGSEPILYSPLEEISLPFSEGIWRIGYQSVDWSGNEEPIQTIELKIDQTAPVSKLSNNGIESNLPVLQNPGTIELSAEDPLLTDGSTGSGVKTIEYALGADGDWTTYQEPFSLEGTDVNLIQYRSVDLAGNVETTHQIRIFSDHAAPTTKLTINGDEHGSPISNQAVTVGFIAEDPALPDGTPGSGVQTIEYALGPDGEWTTFTEPFVVDSVGTHLIRYRATDQMGNIEDQKSTTIIIDQTAPVTRLWINGKPDGYPYTNSTIELRSEDPILPDGSPGSGIKTIEYSLDQEPDWTTYQGPITVDAEGEHVIRYRAIDQAGNVEEYQEKSFYLDRSPTETFFDLNGCDQRADFYRCPLRLEISAEDYDLPDGSPGAGVDRIEYRSEGSDAWITYMDPLEFTASGRYPMEFRSFDRAGNMEPVRDFTFQIDLESPVSNAAILGQPDASGRYPPGTRIAISALDPSLSDGSDGSGLDYIEYSLDSTGAWTRFGEPVALNDQGAHTIYYRAIDWAGNVEQIRSLQIEIGTTVDTAPPVLAVFANPMQLWPPNNKLVPVKIYGTVSDTGSGIRSIHIQVVDEYGTCQPVVTDIGTGDIVNGNWERTIQLEASRKGNDKDGRKYTIRVTATDNAGNVTVREIVVIVPHDQGH
jgi:hypothetical protein